MKKNDDKYLKVFKDRSEYYDGDSFDIFKEGVINDDTKKRITKIRGTLKDNWLEDKITQIKDDPSVINIEKLNATSIQCIESLVESVTSEVGRALVGLTVLQLTIKSIEPKQDIRLHKGGNSRGAFSWEEGISMRVLDKNFITPTLRRHDLIRLNADGFMMTRSLAENYPYTKVYKAKLRGARQEWITIVDLIQKDEVEPIVALEYLISLLINKSVKFQKLAREVVDKVKTLSPNKEEFTRVIYQHIESSDYAARLMEVAMHSLLQVVIDIGTYGLMELKPLSQMRSANKKHGNVGDIELIEENDIVVAWDAKYGKGYLRDEIDELSEKIALHNKLTTVGFVTTEKIKRKAEIEKKLDDFKAFHDLEVIIMSLHDWVEMLFSLVIKRELNNEHTLSHLWLIAYAESLGQFRREKAPIDEPCLDWLKELEVILSQNG